MIFVGPELYKDVTPVIPIINGVLLLGTITFLVILYHINFKGIFSNIKTIVTNWLYRPWYYS